MKSDHIHAANLFHRLFSYSPRPQRKPLEDFCTEALAWCLIQSPTFHRQFFEAIRASLEKNGKMGPLLKCCVGAVKVFTQYSYRGEPMDDESSDASGIRFDLVLRSIPDTELMIAIESKVGLDGRLGNQVAAYRKALENPEWKRVQERYVVTLTPSSHSSASADAHLSWDKVYRLLINPAKEKIAR